MDFVTYKKEQDCINALELDGHVFGERSMHVNNQPNFDEELDRTLYVINIPLLATKESLTELLEPFCKPLIIMHASGKRSQGATIQFKSRVEATVAKQMLHKYKYDSSLLVCYWARKRSPTIIQDENKRRKLNNQKIRKREKYT
eukprot:UN01290